MRRERAINLQDVAIRARVSPSTASRVLRRSGYVAEETKNRILNAVRELGYVPDETARALRNGKGRLIVILAPRTRYNYYQTLIATLEREISRRGYHPFTVYQSDAPDDQALSLLTAYRQTIEGVIVCDIGGEAEMQMIRSLTARGVPALATSPIHGLDIETFATDLENGAAAATRHLLAKNHTRVGIALYVAPENGRFFETESRRRLGYLRAMAEAGLEPIVHAILWEESERFRHGMGVIEQTGGAGLRPTAWVFSNDETAIGAMRALRLRGVAVPDDVAIIGWNNLQIGEFTTPSLTTISLYSEEHGIQIAKRLFERLDGDRDREEITSLPVSLIIRESCGGPI